MSCWEDVTRHLDVELYWTSHPAVRRRIDQRVSGDPNCVSPITWFARRMATELPFKHALSVGCGTGPLERSIFPLGIAEHMTGVDESENAIGFARTAAADAGLAGRVEYLVADARQVLRETSGWDAIFFHASLHHFDRLEELFQLIRGALKPGGVLVLDEYIGPSRKEWSWKRLVLPNLLYWCLPHELRRTKIIRKPVTAEDPTEAVCSSEIGPLVRKHFEIVEWRDYGGNLLSLIYQSLNPPPKSDAAAMERFNEAVEFLLDIEDALLAHPLITRARSFQAFIIARNRRG